MKTYTKIAIKVSSKSAFSITPEIPSKGPIKMPETEFIKLTKKFEVEASKKARINLKTRKTAITATRDKVIARIFDLTSEIFIRLF
ncbi:MAG: hypothetical protein Kow0081_0090 [Candidatus Dojkabacteria bacterium]